MSGAAKLFGALAGAVGPYVNMSIIKEQLKGKRSFDRLEVIANLVTDGEAFEQATSEVREWLSSFNIDPDPLERQDVGDLISTYCSYLIAEQYLREKQAVEIVGAMLMLLSKAYSSYPERFKSSWNELVSLSLEAKDTYSDLQEWFQAINFPKLSKAATLRWYLLTYHYLSEGPYRRCLGIIDSLIKLTKKDTIEFTKLRNTDLGILVNRVQNAKLEDLFTEVYSEELRNAYSHLTINRLTDHFDIQIRGKDIHLTEGDLSDRVIRLLKTVELMDVAFKLFFISKADELRFCELDKIGEQRYMDLFRGELIVNGFILREARFSENKGKTYLHLQVVSIRPVNRAQIRSMIEPRKDRICFYIDKATSESADAFSFDFFDDSSNLIDSMRFKSPRLKLDLKTEITQE